MKKALALLLTTIMLFTVVPVAFGGFEDYPKPNHWVYDEFKLVYDAGLLKGYPDGTFKGERYATRYEMVALTARVLQLIESKVVGLDRVPAGQVVGLTESQVKDIINEILAEKDYATYAELTDDYFALQEIMDNKDERLAEEIYEAIKALEEEFRSELYDYDIRISLLETEVQLLKYDVADLQATVGGMDEKVDTAAKDAKSAKTLGIIGIILGIAGIVL